MFYSFAWVHGMEMRVQAAPHSSDVHGQRVDMVDHGADVVRILRSFIFTNEGIHCSWQSPVFSQLCRVCRRAVVMVSAGICFGADIAISFQTRPKWILYSMLKQL